MINLSDKSEDIIKKSLRELSIYEHQKSLKLLADYIDRDIGEHTKKHLKEPPSRNWKNKPANQRCNFLWDPSYLVGNFWMKE